MDPTFTPWQRFWCPREGVIQLGSDGFLVDPQSDWGHLRNPDVQPVDFLTEIPCLVLLGEPGIGKSTTLQAERQTVEMRLTEVGQEVLWVDLHEVGTDFQLYRQLFETPQFLAWKQGTQVLNLFLDSLDECRVQINTLPSLLLSEFRRCPVERLRLRIACRTADWPAALERGLTEIWGADAVKLLELAPLRRVDIERAATTVNVDSDEFIAAVIRVGAVPLAIKPLTLDFLIRTFFRRGTLPASQAELYGEGCRLLCEESEGRQELRLARLLEARQRVSVAKRIAALTVFGNRAAVAIQPNRGDLNDDDLPVSALSGGTELANGDAFAVEQASVEETLNTGLFTSRGQGRLGWAHRTYAEFLAARWVTDHDLSLPQVLSLIVHPDDLEGKLVPQLHETVAWLAGMRRDLFLAVLSRDPEVLLRSDVDSARDEDRAGLVLALLQATDAGEWFDRDWGLRRHYAKLRHPGLADQLRNYITNAEKGPVVRRVAIHIAEDCEVRDLLGDLVAVALDPKTSVDTRVSAAYAVIGISDEDSRRQLRGLIKTPPEVDPDFQLRGCGLKATWPGLLPANELLEALVPYRGNLLGAYRTFLYDGPMRHLSTGDLPKALRWAQQYANQSTIPRDIEDLINAIMIRAWIDLDVPDVLAGFGTVALARARHGDSVFTDEVSHLLEDIDRRRCALEGAVAVATGDDVEALVSSGLVLPTDATWLVEQYRLRPDAEKERWALLLRFVVRRDDLQALDAAWLLCEIDSLFKEIMSPFFDPIPLDSEEVLWHQERLRRMQAREERRVQQHSRVQPLPAERITRFLEQFVAGDLSAWWQLNLELTLEPGGTHYGDQFESDLTVLPGWRDVSEETRQGLVEAAERYVGKAIPNPDDWMDWDREIKIVLPDWAGFRALRLLQARSPETILNLPAELWARWAPVIIAYPMFETGEHNAWLQHLVVLAYRYAPSDALAALDRRIDAENSGEAPSVERLLWLVALCWDDRLAAALLEKARVSDVVPIVMGQLLEALLDHRVEDATLFACSLIPIPLPQSGPERARAIVAASQLLKNAAELGWSTVWPAMQQDHLFAEGVLGQLVWDDRHTGAIAAQLTDEQVADLYIWLCRQYPPEEDPIVNGLVEYRAAVGMWRDALLTQLRLRGTKGACQAIERIASAFPEREWLKATLLEARSLMRQRTWIPPSPEEIRALAQSTDRRLVQNADQLLDVIVESLSRLEDKLQLAEPPAVIDLWDQVGKKLYKPKDEERLSDYLKRHLDDDLRGRGIVFNREVVNRRGEETDIRVEALLRGANGEELDPLTVIIEVKGCWDKHLVSAMKTQLVERYLAETRTSHGLYVAGWYNCNQWDPNDWRNKRAPRYDKDEAQLRLDAQAAELSRCGKVVRAVVLDTSLRH
jgi:hypothetical protein